MDDAAVVSAQIGRPVRGAVDVAARCHLGLPTVVRVPPVLEDGTPFPTRYWLTCPVACCQVSRLESAGAVRDYQRRRQEDPAFAAASAAADRSYAAERDAALPAAHTGPRPSGGVAGSAAGVKCLHAHVAHHLAGGANPIGAEVHAMIGPTGCTGPCVEEPAS